MQINSRVSVIKIGQNWKVRPEVYDAFTRFRHAHSYTRVTDALHYLLCVALTILGFLSGQQIPEVAKRVPDVYAGSPALLITPEPDPWTADGLNRVLGYAMRNVR